MYLHNYHIVPESHAFQLQMLAMVTRATSGGSTNVVVVQHSVNNRALYYCEIAARTREFCTIASQLCAYRDDGVQVHWVKLDRNRGLGTCGYLTDQCCLSIYSSEAR